MRKVTQREFYDAVYALKVNIHPVIQPGKWSYTAIWKFNNGDVFGKDISGQTGRTEPEYYLNN